MCLSRSWRRVENSCQQCSTCSARVFTAVGSRPRRPNLRRSSIVKAVPLVVKASNSLSCPRLSSNIEKSLLPSCGGHGPTNYTYRCLTRYSRDHLDVAEASYWAYRERFLYEKSGTPNPSLSTSK